MLSVLCLLLCSGQHGVRTEKLPDEWFDSNTAFSTVTDFYGAGESITAHSSMDLSQGDEHCTHTSSTVEDTAIGVLLFSAPFNLL